MLVGWSFDLGVFRCGRVIVGATSSGDATSATPSCMGDSHMDGRAHAVVVAEASSGESMISKVASEVLVLGRGMSIQAPSLDGWLAVTTILEYDRRGMQRMSGGVNAEVCVVAATAMFSSTGMDRPRLKGDGRGCGCGCHSHVRGVTWCWWSRAEYVPVVTGMVLSTGWERWCSIGTLVLGCMPCPLSELRGDRSGVRPGDPRGEDFSNPGAETALQSASLTWSTGVLTGGRTRVSVARRRIPRSNFSELPARRGGWKFGAGCFSIDGFFLVSYSCLGLREISGDGGLGGESSDIFNLNFADPHRYMRARLLARVKVRERDRCR